MYFGLALEQEKRVEEEVNRQLVKRDKEQFKSLYDDLPGEGLYFPKKTPREELAFYEEQIPLGYFENLHATFPEAAYQEFRRFAYLVQRYRTGEWL